MAAQFPAIRSRHGDRYFSFNFASLYFLDARLSGIAFIAPKLETADVVALLDLG